MLFEVQTFYAQRTDWARAATVAWAATEALRGLRIGYSATGILVAGGLLFLTGCWSYAQQRATVLALFVIPPGVLLAVAVLAGRPIFPASSSFWQGSACWCSSAACSVLAGAIGRRLPMALNGPRTARWAAGVMIGSAALVSMLALPALYRYPKQDYEGALRYVDATAGPDDAVLSAGVGTAVPYQRYYGRSWRRLQGAADLAHVREQGKVTWVLFTLRQYLDALEPDLIAEITARCTPVKTFPATVGGGQIVVTRCGPSASFSLRR